MALATEDAFPLSESALLETAATPPSAWAPGIFERRVQRMRKA